MTYGRGGVARHAEREPVAWLDLIQPTVTLWDAALRLQRDGLRELALPQ